MTGWEEESSRLYQRLAAVAVPNRDEQMAALLTLLPFALEDSFKVVELASGEGKLSWAILQAFPQATLLALDGSDVMRQATSARLKPFGQRASVAEFEMQSTQWYRHIEGVDCVISSLCVHHLNAEEKRYLFKGVASRLSDRGVFLMADLVEPQREEARRLFEATYNESARKQSIALTGSDSLYDDFVREKWNYYSYPDPYDKPSPLFHQLIWLKEAGFAVVDAFWMQAGHAIYGGYHSMSAEITGLSFGDALAIAQEALHSDSTD